MKVTVIGGGSTYTPELIKGFIDNIASFPLTELWLMDIDTERLSIVGKFAQRIVLAQGAPFKVVLSTNQRESIQGSSYVITQLRVGKMQARREDEYLGKRHGLIGQETTGVGGMAKALRTIPVILDIAKDIQETTDNALLVNFTNPSGLITEALFRYAPDVQSVGLCNVAINMKMFLIEEWKKLSGEHITLNDVRLDTLGLNHLTWHRDFTIHGKSIWKQLMTVFKDRLGQDDDEYQWDWDTINALNMIPNYYLAYYYYTQKKLAQQKNWPPSRAEEVMEIEKSLLAEYAEEDRTEVPEDLMKRGGAYYSTLATKILNAHYSDTGEIHEVNIRQNGAVSDWPPDWVLEMPAKIERSGIKPLPTKPLPPVCFGVLAAVKSYELLTVEAAVHGDRNAAYKALLVHPLGPEADKIKYLLEDMLKTNQAYLPQFS
jgi:6-phospho-beta-glucosidase